jgi:IS5 family transposase
MRVDKTVVETKIHYPTDSSLWGDGVRVLIRTMKKIAEIALARPEAACATPPQRETAGARYRGAIEPQRIHAAARCSNATRCPAIFSPSFREAS